MKGWGQSMYREIVFSQGYSVQHRKMHALHALLFMSNYLAICKNIVQFGCIDLHTDLK